MDCLVTPPENAQVIDPKGKMPLLDEASSSVPAACGQALFGTQIMPPIDYMLSHFEEMGFDPIIVHKAISELGNVSENALVEHMLMTQHMQEDGFGNNLGDAKRFVKDEEAGSSSVTHELEMTSAAPRPSKRSRRVGMLQAMGFSHGDVEEAIVKYGDGEPVDLVDGILAMKHAEDGTRECQQIGESSSSGSHCLDDEMVVESEESRSLAKFKRMGFAADLVEKAVKDCGDADDAIILDYIVALETHGTSEEAALIPESTFSQEDQILSSSGCDDPELEPMQVTRSRKSNEVQNQVSSRCRTPLAYQLPACGSDEDMVVEGSGDNRSLAKFKGMGFAADLVEKAVKACGDADDATIIDYIAALETHGISEEAALVQESTSSQEDQLLSSSECDDHELETMKVTKPKKKYGMQNRSSRCRRRAPVFGGSDEEMVAVDYKKSRLLAKFGRMGYPAALVKKAIKACGDADDATIVDYIAALETHNVNAVEEEEPVPQEDHILSSDEYSSDQLRSMEIKKLKRKKKKLRKTQPFSSPQEHATFIKFESMGYAPAVVRAAIRACGDADDATVIDYITALETGGVEIIIEDIGTHGSRSLEAKGRKLLTGFGLPGEMPLSRTLPVDASGPPFFYFENVYSMPKHQWDNISRFLYHIPPEFVDASIFSVCSRPRGYIHNLPLHGREEIFTSKKTIKEMFPHTTPYWPQWDYRDKLNCICTVNCPSTICQRAAMLSAPYGGQPPQEVVKETLNLCKTWNLIWVGPNQLAPLEPQEIETCMGFDLHHTRGVTSMTERLNSLGNSFQVNTVAYHFSVLKPLFPHGIRVLSLFAGIGGAEVALHRLGIPLLFVVSVEIADKNRQILQSWWKKTQPPGRGRHVLMEDVRDLTPAVLQKLVSEAGGFDLIVGGSPCQNFSGMNRHHRIGLEGEKSGLFYEFPRILNDVKRLMRNLD